MITLIYILQNKFPSANFITDIRIRSNDKGYYIDEWNFDEVQPTQEQLDLWAIELDLQYRQELARNSRIYPSITDQLDMQYHDRENGTTTWIDTITAIKLAHPIPTE